LFTETHLQYDEPFALPGYTCQFFNSKHSQSDGIAIFVKSARIDSFTFKSDWLKHSANAANLIFTFEKEIYSILNIYRSPSTNIDMFLEELEFAIDSMLLSKSMYQIIIGDINLNIIGERLNNKHNQYLNLLFSKGFTPCINSPTRETQISSTCIDHIFFRSSNTVTNIPIKSCILKSTVTDHYTTMFSRDSAYLTNILDDHCDNIPRTKINYESLVCKVKTETWDETLRETDASSALELFMKTLNKHILKSTETTNVRVNSRYKKIKPWITAGLIKSIRNRDKMHLKLQKLKRKPNTFNLEIVDLTNKYKLYRNYLNKLITKTKNDYYAHKIRLHESNPKKMWNVINEITDRNTASKKNKGISQLIIDGELHTTADNPIKTADTLVDYFTNVGPELANKINNIDTNAGTTSNTDTYNSIPRNPHSIYLTPVSDHEIKRHISSLRINSASGHDELAASTIKAVKEYIARPLSHIFNLCIEQGVFPQALKTAIIIPVYKGNDKTKPENYRPISVLSHIAKLLEKCIKTRLMSFLNHFNILSPNQFGFRSKLSTDDAIYHITSHIYASLDQNEKVLTVFLDLAKAFDTVHHEILLHKLEVIGVRGVALQLFRDYLENRDQAVQLGNILSSRKILTYGVPQGTVLGPILFIIYINDLCAININGKVFTYADDTALVFKGNNWKEVYTQANRSLQTVYNWLNSNKLTLNKSKTIYLPFTITSKTQPPHYEVLKLHDNICQIDKLCKCIEIQRSNSVKYLGITIDSNLRWTEHISKCVSRARKLLYVFYRLRNIMSKPLLFRVYSALVQPILQYGIVGWGGIRKSHLYPLVSVQKCILKVMMHKQKRYSSDALFSESPVLNISDIFIKRAILHTHHYSHKYKANQGFPAQITRSNNIHSYIFNVVVPKKNKHIGQKHVDYLGPLLYNNLPLQIRSCNTVNTFKKCLKIWLRDEGYINLSKILESVYSV
jgi:hypothetical protein